MKSVIASERVLHLVLSNDYLYIFTAFGIHNFRQLFISNDSAIVEWIVTHLAAFTYCVITNREDSQMNYIVKKEYYDHR